MPRKSKRGGARPGAGRPRRNPEKLRALGAKPRPGPKQELSLAVGLDLFIAGVGRERETFSARLIPGSTALKNLDGTVFAWSESHPLTIMKSYADDIVQHKIPAGSLGVQSCVRFLRDLDDGHTRGIFIDPVAVENIATWFHDFNVTGFQLQPWELFIVGQAIGWKQPSGLRRFREVWLEVAKKNGKTAIQGGVALFLILADQEPRAEVYSIANSRDQARICYRAAKQMLDENPNLAGACQIHTNAFIAGTSFYRVLSSEAKSLDGPNVHGGLFDEVHEFSDSSLWEKVTAGIVARRQPLIFSCTTAGVQPESFAGQRHDFMVKLLTGVFEDDAKLAFVASLDADDDWKDEAMWVKANPNLEVTVRAIALREQVQEIRENPSKLTPFLRYHCNVWYLTRAGHTLPTDKIQACAGPYPKLSPLELRAWFLEASNSWSCWGGFDLGVVEDMTCFIALYPEVRFEGTGAASIVAIPHFWIPEMRIDEKKRLWRVPLDVWVRDGWIKTTPGDYVDIAVIKEDLKQIVFNIQMKDCGFDAWNAQVLMSELNDEKVGLFTKVPQIESYLTTPAQEFIRSVVQERFVHLKNPVLIWQMGNAILEESDRGGIVCKKNSTNEKVDAIQALLNAFQRYLNPDEETKNMSALARAFAAREAAGQSAIPTI
jgi:phage terminase large subunit-like protein